MFINHLNNFLKILISYSILGRLCPETTDENIYFSNSGAFTAMFINVCCPCWINHWIINETLNGVYLPSKHSGRQAMQMIIENYSFNFSLLVLIFKELESK